METIRETIIRVLGNSSVEFDATTVAMLEEKVLGAVDPTKNIEGFTYTITHRWVIDAIRKRTVAARRQAKTLLATETAQREAERTERCRKEFDAIVTQVLCSLRPWGGLRSAKPKQLAVARLVHFEGGLNPARFAELFPGCTQAQRYAWETRGVRLVLPHASKELREFLLGAQ